MAIGPQLKWIRSKIQGRIYLVFFFILSILISYLIIKNLGSKLLINTVLVGSAFLFIFHYNTRFFC